MTSDGLEPKVAVAMLNDFFTSVVDATLSEQGILDKYLGDAALSVFGLPLPDENHSLRAVNSAFKMKSGLDALNAKQRKLGRLPLRIGMTIATGMILSGNIGSVKRLEYTVVGDNVRLVQELCAASKCYGVLIAIDEFTYNQVKDFFYIREIDRVNLCKVKNTPIYEVVESNNEELPVEIIEAHDAYSLGLEQYRKMSWQTAIQNFIKAIQLIDDEASKHMIERVRAIMTKQVLVPQNWDGSWPPRC
jgi:adenylate cyclase